MALISTDPIERWHEAVRIVQARREAAGALKQQMADVATHYNGDYVMPVFSTHKETHPVLSAALVAQAVDDVAVRANDQDPMIFAPAVSSGRKGADNRAQLRRKVWASRWESNAVPLKRGRAYRQLAAYNTMCWHVRPDLTRKCVKVSVRNVLNAYPEEVDIDEVRPPNDVGFVFGRSRSWLMQQFGHIEAVRNYVGRAHDTGGLWDLMEWWDADTMMIGIIGQRWKPTGSIGVTDTAALASQRENSMLLAAYPNRAGITPVSCPNGVTLDRSLSAINRAIPIYETLNKLTVLDVIAKERGVFPDMYVLGNDTRQPELVAGGWRPGITGEMNLVANASGIGVINYSTGPDTQMILSNLERNVRLTTGASALGSGELSGSIRSGQTINQLASFSVDPRVKEMHNVMAHSLGHVNDFIAAMENAYFPRRKYTVFSGWTGDTSQVEYTPADIWEEGAASVVRYPMPGMDGYNASITIATMMETEMISKDTGRLLHPFVHDSDLEHDKIAVETVKTAIEQSFAQAVQSGQMAMTDLARVYELMSGGKDLHEAVIQANEEAQARQAEQVPATDPAAQPGINDPTSGGQAGVQPPAGPPPDMAQFFAALGGPGGGGTGPGGGAGAAIPAGAGGA